MDARSGLQSMQAFSARQKWRMHVAPCSSSDTSPSQFPLTRRQQVWIALSRAAVSSRKRVGSGRAKSG